MIGETSAQKQANIRNFHKQTKTLNASEAWTSREVIKRIFKKADRITESTKEKYGSLVCRFADHCNANMIDKPIPQDARAFVSELSEQMAYTTVAHCAIPALFRYGDTLEKIGIRNMLKNVSKNYLLADAVNMRKGDYRMIPFGVAMELPQGYFAKIYPRSSTYKKHGIIMANSVGIVDNTYKGNDDIWQFPAIAMRDTCIVQGTRIAQFELCKAPEAIDFEPVEHLGNPDRGGIGSTGE